MANNRVALGLSLALLGRICVSGLRSDDIEFLHDEHDMSSAQDVFHLFTEADVLILPDEEVDRLEADSLQTGEELDGTWFKRASQVSLVDQNQNASRWNPWGLWGISSAVVHGASWAWGAVSKAATCAACPNYCYLRQEAIRLGNHIKYIVNKLKTLRAILKGDAHYSASAIDSIAEQVKSADTRLHMFKGRLEQVQVKLSYTPCQVIMTVVHYIYSFIKDHECLLVSVGLESAAGFLDDALAVGASVATEGALAAAIVAVKASPICEQAAFGRSARRLLGKTGALASHVLAVAGNSLCKFLEMVGPFASQFLRKAMHQIGLSSTCSIASTTEAIVEFGINVACGQMFSAVLAILEPMIMSHLPLGPGGEACE